MDGPFLGVSAVSFCLPGFWLCLGALCSAVAHLHFLYLHSLWVAEVAFVTGLVLCLTGILGAYGSTHRCLWPISVFVGAAFAVLSLETATGVIFLCQWNLVEETAKEHDQTGALLLMLRCIEAHPVIISWLMGSFFILQVSTLFLAAHHAFDISMDAEEPEEETSVEDGERQDEKAPLLLAYEQAYLPKPSRKQASEDEDQPHSQLASHRAVRRCRVPEWRDVLLTAALLWLAATGLVLIIAMVKVGMYQGPGLGHHAMHQDAHLHTALAAPDAPSQNAMLLPALAIYSAQPDSKEDQRHGEEGHAGKAEKRDKEREKDDDAGDDDDDDDDNDSDRHHHKAAEEHSHEKKRHHQHRKEKEGGDRAHRKKTDHEDDDYSEGEDKDGQHEVGKAEGSSEEHSDKDADEDEDEQEGSEELAEELGKKPWKKHHHKKHRKHRRHCEDEEPSCQEGAPRWFAGVLGVVGVPMLVLSSVAAAGVWTGIAAVLHMFAGASAVFLASEALLMHIVLNHSSILLTAADFDYSNGLQHTLDFASEHTIATPLLIIALLACQAGAMVAAANFGMPIPVKERVISASVQLRDKVEELNLPEKAAVLYHQGLEKSAAGAVSLRAAASRAAERAGFPAAAARLAPGGSGEDARAGNTAGDHVYTPVAAAAVEEGAVADVASQDASSSGSESKDPWASLRRALHPEGAQHTVRWSDED